MNYKMMGRFTAQMLLIEGIFLIPALLISLFLGESAAAYGFAVTLGLIALVGGPMYFFCRDAKSAFYATDGMVCVAVSWFVLSLVGAIPFYVSEAIPSYIDALFETVSGFTTTGASILPEVEHMAKGLMYWRSFTHWVGGMGVLQNVTTVFMLLFGVNFSCYYLLTQRQIKNVLKDEELRLYVLIVLGSIGLIVWNLGDFYPTLEETVRHAAFQVSSIITTTGFATTDFDLWPSFSKTILLCLMVIGACAGSTGGGLKVARVLLLFKSLKRNIAQMLHPRKVQVIRNNGSVVSERIVANTNAYLCAYVVLMFGSFVLISLDGYSVGTNFSAVLSCLNNIGPGMELVGPTCNFSIFSAFSKLVLILDMLLGRLEIFPILVLVSLQTWKNA